MKKAGFIFFIALVVIAEQINATSKDSISKYYTLRSKAELEIVNSNYPQALSFYKAAFQYKQANEKDLYNAFIIACILKDSISAKPYFNRLVAWGLLESSIKDDLVQDKIDTTFIAKISEDYQQLRSTKEFAVLKRNALFMDTLYDLDQGVRQYATSLYGPVEGIKKFNDSIEKTDAIVLKRMIDFIHKEGFPDIYKTGFLASNYRHVSSFPMIILLLRHLTNMPSSRPEKAELLKQASKAVQEGKLEPREYAFIYDESEGNAYGSVIQYSYYENKKTPIPIPEDRLAEINRARKAIYLEPLDEYAKKLEFMKRCYYFHFFNVFVLMYNQVSYDPNSVKSK